MDEQHTPTTGASDTDGSPAVAAYLEPFVEDVTTRTPPTRTNRWVEAAVVLLLVAASLAMTLTFAVRYSWISPLDESANFDYVYKITQGELVPRPGQVISDETLKVIKCRPSIVYTQPNCDRQQLATQTPANGVDYVLAYGETYYLPAALVATVVHAISPTSWFMAARSASALFFALGIAALYLAGRVYRAPRTAAAGMALAFGATSMVFIQGATVTPDSMAPLAGAAAAIVPMIRLRWRWKMLIALVVGVLIALVKPNLVPLGCLTVLMAGLVQADDTAPFSLVRMFWRLRALAAVALAFVPLAVALVWNAWENSRLPAGVRADGGLNQLVYTTEGLGTLIAQFAAQAISPLSFAPIIPSLWVSLVGALLAIVILGGAVALAMGRQIEGRPELKVMSIGGLIGVLLTTIYVPLVLYLTYHAGGGQGRYVVPALALLVPVVGASMTGRVSRWLMLAYGLATFAFAFYTVLHVH